MARRKKSIKKSKFTAVLFVILAICAIIGYRFFGNSEEEDYEIPDGVCEFHYIDVGQGDATLIQVGETNVLIDTGEKDQESVLNDYLTSHGVSQIDYFFITHFDSDHFGNATFVLKNYTIKNIYLPDQTKTTKMYQTFIETLEEKTTINVVCANEIVGTKITASDLEMTILAPLDTYTNSNDNSIGILARYGKTKFLFTGDAEENALEDICARYNASDLNCDVFQAGHHGSRNANTQDLMDLCTPSTIVISCGEGNSYGHPHSEAMQLFQSIDGVTIYRTDEDGTVVLSTDGETITKKQK